MNPAEAIAQVAEGPWYVDLGVIAAVLVSLTTIWRLAVGPFLRGVWAAIQATPQIPIILDEVRTILQSDVMGKLEDMKVAAAQHQSEAQARDERLDSHTLRLESHDLRLGKLERDMASLRPTEGAGGGD